jgi:hypothetical protein
VQKSTGHLVVTDEITPEMIKAGYEEVPDKLQGTANDILAGRKETMVNLAHDNDLSAWANSRNGKRAIQRKASKRGY